jgi:HSP20 family protein
VELPQAKLIRQRRLIIMSLVRWDPFADLMDVQRTFDRFFDGGMGRPLTLNRGDGGSLWSTDIYQTDEQVVVKMALPGVKPEDVHISLVGRTLTVAGESKADEEPKGRSYLQREHRYGRFSRTLSLPVPVDSDKADAVFEHGILTLTLPKAESVRPKHRPRSVRLSCAIRFSCSAAETSRSRRA